MIQTKDFMGFIADSCGFVMAKLVFTQLSLKFMVDASTDGVVNQMETISVR